MKTGNYIFRTLAAALILLTLYASFTPDVTIDLTKSYVSAQSPCSSSSWLVDADEDTNEDSVFECWLDSPMVMEVVKLAAPLNQQVNVPPHHTGTSEPIYLVKREILV